MARVPDLLDDASQRPFIEVKRRSAGSTATVISSRIGNACQRDWDDPVQGLGGEPARTDIGEEE